MLLHQIESVPKIVPFNSHRLKSLPILVLNIHTLCNCRCVMCDIWKRQQGTEQTAANLERHRESLRNLAVRQVVLSGGEPLLNRDLRAICKFFRSLDIRITLLTTGLLLHKRAALVASLVDEIILSLDGPPAVHNEIRRIPRAFETIARGIETLRTFRPDASISGRTTVQKANHMHLRSTVQAARSLGLNSISFLPADLSSMAFNRDQPWHPERQSEIALNSTEVEILQNEIECLITEYRSDLRSGFILEDENKLRRLTTRFHEHLDRSQPVAPSCNAPWVSTVMEVDGALRPCFFHPSIASTKDENLEQTLNNDDFRSFRTHLSISENSICRRCVCSLNYRVREE